MSGKSADSAPSDEHAALQAALDRQDVGVEVRSVAALTGGASRRTIAISGVDTTGAERRLILQTEPGELRRPEGMAPEANVIAAAAEAGVPVAPVVAVHPPIDAATAAAAPDPTAVPGRSWFVSGAVEGETIARRILRDDRFATARDALPAQLGAALAKIHTTPVDGIDTLEDDDQVARYREVADELGVASPAFELAFRWLELHRPAAVPPALVHGDFRMGNLIIDTDGLAAVIDWELAHLGDPLEDLGWLCVRAWRFGSPLPVGGVGEREALWAAYEAAGGAPVDPVAARWWEVVGTLKWGIMCATQVERHRSGGVRSVELAAIGRRIAEQEYDLCRLLAPAGAEPVAPDPADLETAIPVAANREPSAAELLEAVGEFLTTEVVEGDDPRLGFLGRVVRNVVATVGRELAHGEAQEARHQARLDALGVADDAELAARIRAGAFDTALTGDGDDDLRRSLEARAVDRLVLSNPRWLEA